VYGLKPVPFKLKPVPFKLKPVPFKLKPVPFKLKPVPFKGRDTQDYFNKLPGPRAALRGAGAHLLLMDRGNFAAPLRGAQGVLALNPGRRPLRRPCPGLFSFSPSGRECVFPQLVKPVPFNAPLKQKRPSAGAGGLLMLGAARGRTGRFYLKEAMALASSS